MKILGVKKNISGPILSIDPASHSIAFAVLTSKKLLASGKISLTSGSNVFEKIQIINATIPILIRKHKPAYILIEETVYLQNPKTTVLMAIILGAITAHTLAENVSTGHVAPLKWKPGLGYQNVSKKEKDAWAQELGSKAAAEKRAAFERKERVRLIVVERIPELDETDTDITDAIAIGLWGLENL